MSPGGGDARSALAGHLLAIDKARPSVGSRPFSGPPPDRPGMQPFLSELEPPEADRALETLSARTDNALVRGRPLTGEWSLIQRLRLAGAAAGLRHVEVDGPPQVPDQVQGPLRIGLTSSPGPRGGRLSAQHVAYDEASAGRSRCAAPGCTRGGVARSQRAPRRRERRPPGVRLPRPPGTSGCVKRSARSCRRRERAEALAPGSAADVPALTAHGVDPGSRAEADTGSSRGPSRQR